MDSGQHAQRLASGFSGGELDSGFYVGTCAVQSADIVKEKQNEVVEEIDGRLHTIRDIHDEAGKLLTQIATPLRAQLKFEDIVQLIGGALMLGVPVALTEEVWILGETLPTARIYLIVGLSLLINGVFIKILFYPGNLSEYPVEFIKRVCAAYVVALLVSLLLLALFDMGPLDDPVLALRRAVIIAFPASFAATTVDYIR